MFEHAEDKGYFPGLLEIILVHPSSLALPTVMLQAVSSPSLVCVTVEVDGGMIRAQGVKDIFPILASRTRHSLTHTGGEGQCPSELPKARRRFHVRCDRAAP